MKTVRISGLVLCVALAIGAFGGAASAAASVGFYVGAGSPPKFEAEKYPAHISGSGGNRFNFFGENEFGEGEGYCSGDELEGERPSPFQSQLASVTYSGPKGALCTVGKKQAVIFSEGCFDYYTAEKYEGEAWPGGPTVTIGASGMGCNIGHQMEVQLRESGKTVCTATVQPYLVKPGSTWLWTYGSGSGRYVKVESRLKGIEYTLSGTACPKGTGIRTDGSWNGIYTLKAE